MPSSFPYLNIARKYNEDYGVILMIADHVTYGRTPARVIAPIISDLSDKYLNQLPESLNNFNAMMEEIKVAAHEFLTLRNSGVTG